MKISNNDKLQVGPIPPISFLSLLVLTNLCKSKAFSIELQLTVSIGLKDSNEAEYQAKFLMAYFGCQHCGSASYSGAYQDA
ncbi:hypothetical protein P8452_30647 [Trifolium repens]|nr:hypothetical protein P8452_30647 [Trifolium repens]